LCPGSVGDFNDALPKKARHANDDAIARLDQVDQARFHAGHARGTDGKGHLILRLINGAKHFLDGVHNLQELRIEMAQKRRNHSSKQARMGIARTGTKQQTTRRIQWTWNIHDFPYMLANGRREPAGKSCP
jgi:hypothetical protein